ncbi:hypothetical protein HYW46_04560 [Candidatus Daviesbacteria bacterium]|nr:hypothetical protein [Candidatus Daviesbacteria bacterium]
MEETSLERRAIKECSKAAQAAEMKYLEIAHPTGATNRLLGELLDSSIIDRKYKHAILQTLRGWKYDGISIGINYANDKDCYYTVIEELLIPHKDSINIK